MEWIRGEYYHGQYTYICPSCMKRFYVATNFCSDCGQKLDRPELLEKKKRPRCISCTHCSDTIEYPLPHGNGMRYCWRKDRYVSGVRGACTAYEVKPDAEK